MSGIGNYWRPGQFQSERPINQQQRRYQRLFHLRLYDNAPELHKSAPKTSFFSLGFLSFKGAAAYGKVVIGEGQL